MDGLVVIGVVLLVFLVVVFIWFVSTKNRFKVMLVKIGEANSGIDVALTKRYDTLTSMLDVVKGYAKHETELFQQIVKLRAGMSMAEKNEANKSMNELLEKINVVVENYPELKASDSFIKLKDAIRDAEDHLQAARRVFNMNVSIYNQTIIVFPANIVAGNRYTRQDFFEADENKRAEVRMEF